MAPWITAAVFMAAIAVWLGVALPGVADALPARLAGRARWWRRWAWTVAAGCGAAGCGASAAALLLC
ncbi:hypothetical protein [Cryptosporangium phraense]|uniref:Uncharacterized protein n=1 Tax=Cryptosporangium phraense TaxID=2593070 RepID=A0A545B042_9ACTN|nr:hypothetical protein [Cryptosporangium phraense]TQS46956.1 hypothetical protein FL583_01415 [Cryptosporangium phraense]